MPLRSILILALFLRLALPVAALAVCGTDAFLYNDSANYLHLADVLLHEGRYRGNYGPELYRPPGYPLFLAAALSTPHPYVAIVILQVLLGVFTVYVVFRTAALLLPMRGALAAALLCALDPLLVLWSTKVMSETLFTALVAVFAYALVRYLQGQSMRWLLGAAMAVSTAAYVRAIAYLLPVWVFGLLLILGWRRENGTRLAAHASAFLLLSIVLLVPWNLRNGRESGYYGFSTLGDRSLYFAGGAAIEAERQGQSFYDTRDRMLKNYARLYQDGRDEDASGYREARRQGFALIASAPGTYARFWVAGQVRTLFDPGAVEYLRLFGLYPAFGGLLGRIIDGGIVHALQALPTAQPLLLWMTIAFAVVLMPYLLLPLMAPFKATRASRPAVIALFGLIAFFLLLSGGAYGASRFRHPMEPMLATLAGFAFSGLQASGFGTNRLRTVEPQNRRTSEP